MQTRSSKKSVDTIMIFQSSSISEIEQVDIDLIAMHEEYLKNALGVNWIEMGEINHIDTWRADPNHIILQHMTPEVTRKGKSLTHSKIDVMIDQGLAYYVPYESFTCLELLYSIAHRHNQEGYQIGLFKH